MDANRRLVIIGNERGIALVFIALLLVVICGILGLAVDIGYMYLAKGQLQNAADSAALAGAAKLNGTPTFTTQTSARFEAVKFAAKNTAAQDTVDISSNPALNALTGGNDITVGNWDAKKFPLKPYDETRTPINAVQVRARRTGGSDADGTSNHGPVTLSFGKILAAFNLGPSTMGTRATAIAQRAPKAGFYFMIGQGVCYSTGFPVTISPGVNNMAWTSLLGDHSTDSQGIRQDFMCPAKVPDVDVCGQYLYTSNGTDGAIFKAVETDFYDPNYDAKNKTFRGDGSVDTWTVIVPVSEVNNPSAQPIPYLVWGYAKITMTRACGSGGGNPCSSSGGRSFTAPSGSPRICPGGVNVITISSVTCVDCANSSSMLGSRPKLVQ